MAPNEDEEGDGPEAEPGIQHVGQNRSLVDDDEEVEPPPLTFRESVSEVSQGLGALLLVSFAVLVLFVVVAVLLGLITWLTPAVLAIAAAIVLMRYLARDR